MVPTLRFTGASIASALLLTACSDNRAEPADAPTAVGTPVAAAPAPPVGAASSSAPPQAATGAALAVDSEGLRFFSRSTGSATPLAFGLDAAQVLSVLERNRGPAARGTNESCGAGPVQYANWADGLSLVFQNGRFVGWGLDGRAAGAVRTANGIGPGSTRAELDEAFGTVTVSQTSLGTEFAAGEIFGVLDGPGPGAKITDMWAGVSCVAR
ncbi:MAG TPA: hypothetical protein VFF48_03180 [Brevundimonas sp.]|nr:hypothetical protein [Brevundimonas sp.]